MKRFFPVFLIILSVVQLGCNSISGAHEGLTSYSDKKGNVSKYRLSGNGTLSKVITGALMLSSMPNLGCTQKLNDNATFIHKIEYDDLLFSTIFPRKLSKKPLGSNVTICGSALLDLGLDYEYASYVSLYNLNSESFLYNLLIESLENVTCVGQQLTNGGKVLNSWGGNAYVVHPQLPYDPWRNKTFFTSVNVTSGEPLVGSQKVLTGGVYEINTIDIQEDSISSGQYWNFGTMLGPISYRHYILGIDEDAEQTHYAEFKLKNDTGYISGPLLGFSPYTYNGQSKYLTYGEGYNENTDRFVSFYCSGKFNDTTFLDTPYQNSSVLCSFMNPGISQFIFRPLGSTCYESGNKCIVVGTAYNPTTEVFTGFVYNLNPNTMEDLGGYFVGKDGFRKEILNVELDGNLKAQFFGNAESKYEYSPNVQWSGYYNPSNMEEDAFSTYSAIPSSRITGDTAPTYLFDQVFDTIDGSRHILGAAPYDDSEEDTITNFTNIVYTKLPYQTQLKDFQPCKSNLDFVNHSFTDASLMYSIDLLNFNYINRSDEVGEYDDNGAYNASEIFGALSNSSSVCYTRYEQSCPTSFNYSGDFPSTTSAPYGSEPRAESMFSKNNLIMGGAALLGLGTLAGMGCWYMKKGKKDKKENQCGKYCLCLIPASRNKDYMRNLNDTNDQEQEREVSITSNLLNIHDDIYSEIDNETKRLKGSSNKVFSRNNKVRSYNNIDMNNDDDMQSIEMGSKNSKSSERETDYNKKKEEYNFSNNEVIELNHSETVSDEIRQDNNEGNLNDTITGDQNILPNVDNIQGDDEKEEEAFL